jgi:hypothetical protein
MKTASMEIPGSPISRHDLEVIWREIQRARIAGFNPEEVVVSSRRLRNGLRAFGLPVRPNDELHLSQGLLVQSGREPRFFDFEEREE